MPLQPAPPTVGELVEDLSAEHDSLRNALFDQPAADFDTATASPGWTVADQLGHLGYFDRTAALAITDPDGFATHLEEMLPRLAPDADGNSPTMDSLTLREPRRMTAAQLLGWWEAGRKSLIEAARSLDESTRLPWYGPPMGAKSFLTARLMETWAHGQDICDALSIHRDPTGRLRHIAQLGVITRGWSYRNRGLEAPDIEIHVALDSPGGKTWRWGDRNAAESITGPAHDFCLVVTQRRNVANTGLTIVGDAAAEWMGIAQAFAGGVTDPPKPKPPR